MICCFPYGAILATLFYGVFTLLILTLLADVNNGGSVCEGEDPCRSEGVDNSYITWTSDVYLGLWSILLALHIVIFVPNKPKRKGHLSLVYMGLGYLVRALAQRDFYNSGEGDGKGMKAFFITWPISYFFLTLSIWKFSSYTRRTWQLFNEDKKRKAKCCCGLFEVILFESLTIFTFLIILVACLVCLFDEDISVQHRIDEYPYDEDTPEPIPVQIVMYSNMTWFAWQALFWTASSSLLGTLAMENIQYFWGLPNSLAAASIMVLQLGTGGLWVIMIVLGIEVAEDVRETFLTASSVLFHYGMVMTTLFAHTLMTTIHYAGPAKPKQAHLKAEKDDSPNEIPRKKVGNHRSMGPPSSTRKSTPVSQMSIRRTNPSVVPRIAQDPPTKMAEDAPSRDAPSRGTTVAAMMALRRTTDKSNSSDSLVSPKNACLHQDPPDVEESSNGTSDPESSYGTSDSSSGNIPQCISFNCSCIDERDELVTTAKDDSGPRFASSIKSQRNIEELQEEVIVDDDDDASLVLDFCMAYNSPIETIGKQFSEWGSSFFQLPPSSNNKSQMVLPSASTSSRVQADKLKEETDETKVVENIDSGVISNNVEQSSSRNFNATASGKNNDLLPYLQGFANDFIKSIHALEDKTKERDLEEPEEQQQDRAAISAAAVHQSSSDESDDYDMPHSLLRGPANSDDNIGVTSPPPNLDEYFEKGERSVYSSESSDYATDGYIEQESEDFTPELEGGHRQNDGFKTSLAPPTAMDGRRRDAYLKFGRRKQDAKTRRNEELTTTTSARTIAAANKRKLTTDTLQRHSYTFSNGVPEEEDYRDEEDHPYYLQSDGEARWAAC